MKRLVIKVGSHILTKDNILLEERIEDISQLIYQLREKGYEVILITSGAVAVGYSKIKLDMNSLENRQALSAIGQPFLMNIYQNEFSKYDIITSQFLLTETNFDLRSNTRYAKRVINTLLSKGVLPIINENDTTATKELVFGDNDSLSANVTYYFDCDMLVILSNNDGYYNSEGLFIKKVSTIEDNEIKNSLISFGGLSTKLESAKFLLDRGREMFLSNGYDLSDVREFLLNNNHQGGTLFSQ
ncbi:Glutamate 5-kinase [hydrothermal vent metagenome]|uniref:Glutamate 5-kinase n=1 Tax=hydrothermal vent metagenome TaxID=652676 RepID=A0A1W1ELH6_9ZZZZ